MIDPNDYIDVPEEGALPSGDDDRDWPLIAIAPDAPSIDIPPAYRSGNWPVVNQGHTSTCVGQSGALTRTITEHLVDDIDLRFDGYELYAACKARDGRPNEKGTSIRVALKVLMERGGKTLATPSTFMPISGYVRVQTTVDEIKVALVTLGHVWAALRWCDEWNRTKLAKNHDVMGQPENPSIGHSIAFVGYDDSIDCGPLGKGALRLHNSFGKAWGDGGEAWFPYSLIGRLWDAWTTFDVEDREPEPEPVPEPEPQPEPQPEPKPSPEPEDAVKLLTEIVPGQVAAITAGPVFDPTTLKQITTLGATDSAKIIGHTTDGKYFGIVVSTRHLKGPDPKLLLIPAERLSHLRVPVPPEPAELAEANRKLAAVREIVDA